MADDVAALMDHLGIAQADVLGRSHGRVHRPGGCPAPSRVCTAPRLESTAAVSSVRNRMLFEHLLRLMEAGHDRRTVLGMLFLWDNSQTLMGDTALFDQAVEQTLSDPCAQSVEGFRNQLQAITHHDTRERLAEISIPCLVIAGAEDLLIPAEEQKALLTYIRHARWLCLPGRGTVCMRTRQSASIRLC